MKLFVVVLAFPLWIQAQCLPDYSQQIVVAGYKEKTLPDSISQFWHHKDIIWDGIPGTSIDKAYAELWKETSDTLIVAVIDNGTDIDHEDLQGIIWKNTKEIPGNRKDDDGNGYVDDVHGWNFLGNHKGKSEIYGRLVSVRILEEQGYFKSKGKQKSLDSIGELAKVSYEEDVQWIEGLQEYVEEVETDYQKIRVDLANYFPEQHYSLEKLQTIDTLKYPELGYAVRKLHEHITYEATPEWVEEVKIVLDINRKYKLNSDFEDRKISKDNVNDLSDTKYGNADIRPTSEYEDHGTGVSSIIAGLRNNQKGGNGVVNQVKIMPIRAIPSDGDEYDKDVALAIRYAVDNGAKVVNMSFAKEFSPNVKFVEDAIRYAAKHNVLLVHAAGNENENTDVKFSYPLDHDSNQVEIASNFINVGAISLNMNRKFPAYFTNYGKQNVDLFAPGVDIYTAAPNNTYDTGSGTSYASPIVAGIAAMIRLQYPELSAAQVRDILMAFGNVYHIRVRVPGTKKKPEIPFSELSKSGKVVNAYNALKMAAEMSK